MSAAEGMLVAYLAAVAALAVAALALSGVGRRMAAFRGEDGGPALPRWRAVPCGLRWAAVGLTVAVALLLIGGGLAITVRLIAVIFAPGALGVAEGEGWADIRNALFVIAAALGVPLVIWRAYLTTRQTQIQQESHFTDLYAKAVEMLGADKEARSTGDGQPKREPNIEVRLGAIYALERISKQSDADYLPIMDVLCAYVRQNAEVLGEPPADLREPPAQETPEVLATRLEDVRTHKAEVRAWVGRLRAAAAEPGRAIAERPDLSAALDVLARRSAARRALEFGKAPSQPPDPPPLGLQDRPFPCDAADAKKRLQRIVEYREAILPAWAQTRWRPHLVNATLQGAYRPADNADAPRLDLRRADARRIRMEGAEDLRGARLEGADLSGARMQGANLSGARMQGATLNFARLQVADLSGAQMQGATLQGARMEGTILSEAQMEGARLSGAIMEQAILNDARMEGTGLARARMQGADLRSARMEGAYFGWARMQETVLYAGRMEGAHLVNARIEGANLFRARLNSAETGCATFARSLLASTDFTNARSLTLAQLANAFGDAATILPAQVSKLPADEALFILVRNHGWADCILSDREVYSAYSAWLAARKHLHPRWLTQQLTFP